MPRPANDTELTRAAAVVEAELARFEATAREAADQRLDSRKNLERGVRAMQRAAEVEERLVAGVAALVAAVRAATTRQQAAVDELQAFGRALQERQAGYLALAERFEAFGRDAAGLNDRLRGGDGDLTAVRQEVARLRDMAAALAVEAEARDFRDLERDAIARRDQLEAALDRLPVPQEA